MDLLTCLAVSFLRACVSSVPANDSLLLVLFPGPLTLFMVLFCGLAAAVVSAPQFKVPVTTVGPVIVVFVALTTKVFDPQVTA